MYLESCAVPVDSLCQWNKEKVDVCVCHNSKITMESFQNIWREKTGNTEAIKH